jgi:Ring finger domain
MEGFTIFDDIINMILREAAAAPEHVDQRNLPVCSELLRRMPVISFKEILVDRSRHSSRESNRSSKTDIIATGARHALVADRGECVICTSTFNDPLEPIVALHHCKHVFHQECIRGWFERKSTCPTCRTQYETDNATYLHSIGLHEEAIVHEQATEESHQRQDDNLEHLREILRESLLLRERSVAIRNEAQEECEHCGTDVPEGTACFRCVDCTGRYCTDCYELGFHTEHDMTHEFAYIPGDAPLMFDEGIEDMTEADYDRIMARWRPQSERQEQQQQQPQEEDHQPH